MQGVALVERYRSYAAKCVKLSRNVLDPTAKLVLLEMAQSWLNLAEQAAEGAAVRSMLAPAVPESPQSD